MSKKGVIVLSFVALMLAVILIGSRIQIKHTFSEELLAELPGCTKSREMFNSKDNFTESEFKEMKLLATECSEAQIKHLKSSQNPSGVTNSYEFK